MVTNPATPGAAAASGYTHRSYLEWGAIIAGALVATTLSFVLISFGTGLGLAMVSPEPGEGLSVRWVAIAAGIWFIWVVISSIAAGGYLAGRMRPPVGDAVHDERETRDGAHGLVVWALGALIGIVMTSSGIGSIMGAAGSVTQQTVDLAAEQTDYFASLMLRSETGTVVDNAAVREEIGTIITRSLAEGEVAPADRTYLASLVAAQTGVDQAAAEAQVDAAIAQAQNARQALVDAAEQARIFGIISSFVIAATLLVAAAAAYFAAIAGGHHRDENIPFRSFAR